jgi:hypothetical protein
MANVNEIIMPRHGLKKPAARRPFPKFDVLISLPPYLLIPKGFIFIPYCATAVRVTLPPALLAVRVKVPPFFTCDEPLKPTLPIPDIFTVVPAGPLTLQLRVQLTDVAGGGATARAVGDDTAGAWGQLAVKELMTGGVGRQACAASVAEV